MLGRRRRVWGWHGHRDGAVHPRDGLTTQRGIHRGEGLAMCGEDLVQSFRQVLQEMKAVSDLDGGGGTLVCAVGIGFRPITRDHLHSRMLPEPLRQGRRGAIGKERDRLAALEIDQHRAIGLAFQHREIVHAEDDGARDSWDRQPAEHAQEGATTDGHAQATAEPYVRCPA
jgi:hypothetical protein